MKDQIAIQVVKELNRTDAGKKAEAASQEKLQKYYMPATAAALAVLLFGLVVSCVIISRLRQRDPNQRDQEEALGRGDTDFAWEREDQSRAKGKAEPEETRKAEAAGGDGIFSNCSSPLPSAFAAELAQRYRDLSTDPSPLPTCPSCSYTDDASSLDTWISLDSPQPTYHWCPCYQYQQGYCTSEDEVF